MYTFIGILIHLIVAIILGSFYLPYRSIKSWSWESAWLIGCVGACILFPFALDLMTIPDVWQLLSKTPSHLLLWIYALGLVWGIGYFTLGLAMRHIGVALGMALSLGTTIMILFFIPPLYQSFLHPEDNFSNCFSLTVGNRFFLGGIFLALVGVFMGIQAGKSRTKEFIAYLQQVSSVTSLKGIRYALVSGIATIGLGLGVEMGRPIADMSLLQHCHPFFQYNLVLTVLLSGVFTTNLLACLYLNIQHQSFADYSFPIQWRNYGLALLAGVMWGSQLFLFGMGKSLVKDSTYTWTIHLGVCILTTTIWGLLYEEWKGVSSKTMFLNWTGIFFLLLSVLLIAIGYIL